MYMLLRRMTIRLLVHARMNWGDLESLFGFKETIGVMRCGYPEWMIVLNLIAFYADDMGCDYS